MTEAPEVRVRFNVRVFGYRPGEIASIPATPVVDNMVRSGMLTWLDDPRG